MYNKRISKRRNDSIFSKWISNVPNVSTNKEDVSFRIVKPKGQKYMLGFEVLSVVVFWI